MLTRACYATFFLMTSAIGIVFVFLADLQDRNGLANWELGTIASMGFVAALASQLLLSPLADRGHTRELAFGGVIAAAAGTIGFAFVDQTWSLAGSRAAVGIGMGLFGVVARKALIGLDAEGAGAKLGAFHSVAVAGFISGPAFGAAAGRISFEAPFLIVGVLIALVGLPTAGLVAKADIATAPVSYSDARVLLKRRRVQAALLMQVIFFGFIGIFDAVVDRFLTDLGGSTTSTAIVLLFTGAPLLVLPARMGALAERIGPARLVVPALAIALPAYALFGMMTSVVLIAMMGVLVASGEAIGTMAGQIMVLDETKAERAAIGSAMVEAAGMSIAAVTAILGPIVYGRVGPETLFGGYALIAAGLGGVILLLLSGTHDARTAAPTDADRVPEKL